MAEQNRTSLTFEEKIIVAWSYHVRGISQQDLAAIFNINSGRISEACKSVERALKGGIDLPFSRAIQQAEQEK